MLLTDFGDYGGCEAIENDLRETLRSKNVYSFLVLCEGRHEVHQRHRDERDTQTEYLPHFPDLHKSAVACAAFQEGADVNSPPDGGVLQALAHFNHCDEKLEEGLAALKFNLQLKPDISCDHEKNPAHFDRVQKDQRFILDAKERVFQVSNGPVLFAFPVDYDRFPVDARKTYVWASINREKNQCGNIFHRYCIVKPIFTPSRGSSACGSNSA